MFVFCSPLRLGQRFIVTTVFDRSAKLLSTALLSAAERATVNDQASRRNYRFTFVRDVVKHIKFRRSHQTIADGEGNWQSALSTSKELTEKNPLSLRTASCFWAPTNYRRLPLQDQGHYASGSRMRVAILRTVQRLRSNIHARNRKKAGHTNESTQCRRGKGNAFYQMQNRTRRPLLLDRSHIRFSRRRYPRERTSLETTQAPRFIVNSE